MESSIRRELNGLIADDTLTLCDLPPTGEAISGRCVYGWKLNQHNEIIRAKSRFVFEDFMPWMGCFFETHAHTPSASIRLLTSVAVRNGVKLSHFDIQHASVEALSKDEVYMEFPPGHGELAGNPYAE